MENEQQQEKTELKLPELPPHVVASKLADEAIKEGYFIRSIQLVYYTGGEEVLSNIVPVQRQKEN